MATSKRRLGATEHRRYNLSSELILVTEEPRGPSILIEIPVEATVTAGPVPFPSIDELQSDADKTIIIKGMRTITDKVLAFGPLTGLPTAPLTELIKISYKLEAEGWTKAQYIPALVLNDMHDSDSTFATTIPFRDKPTKFNNWERMMWNKCELWYSAGTVPVPSYVVCIEVEYERLNAEGQIIYGPKA